MNPLREPIRRALWGINAARRVAKAVLGGKGVRDALAKERVYFDAHKDAQKRRNAVDVAVDAAAAVYGDLLGWYLGPNENHCKVCPKLAGNNFYASKPPRQGLPGSVHPNCQCFSGPPHPKGRILS